MNATSGTEPGCFALSGLGVCDHDYPGRRCALPWADMFEPLRGYACFQGHAGLRGYAGFAKLSDSRIIVVETKRQEDLNG